MVAVAGKYVDGKWVAPTETLQNKRKTTHQGKPPLPPGRDDKVKMQAKPDDIVDAMNDFLNKHKPTVIVQDAPKAHCNCLVTCSHEQDGVECRKLPELNDVAEAAGANVEVMNKILASKTIRKDVVEEFGKHVDKVLADKALNTDIGSKDEEVPTAFVVKRNGLIQLPKQEEAMPVTGPMPPIAEDKLPQPDKFPKGNALYSEADIEKREKQMAKEREQREFRDRVEKMQREAEPLRRILVALAAGVIEGKVNQEQVDTVMKIIDAFKELQ